MVKMRSKDKILQLAYKADEGGVVIYLLERKKGKWNTENVRKQMKRGFFEGYNEGGFYSYLVCEGLRGVQIGTLDEDDCECKYGGKEDDAQDPMCG